jgi:hypothetical protein
MSAIQADRTQEELNARQLAELNFLLSSDPKKCSERAHTLVRTAQSSGDSIAETMALSFVAHTQIMFGELTAAEETCSRALQIANDCGSPVWKARALIDLAIIAGHAGDDALQLMRFDMVLEFCRSTGLELGVAAALSSLAGLMPGLFSFEDAMSLFDESCALRIQAGRPDLMARTLWGMGNFCWKWLALATLRDDPANASAFAQRATAAFARALKEDRSMVNPLMEATGMFSLGMASLELNDLATAEHALERMDELTTIAPMSEPLRLRCVLQAAVCTRRGQPQAALQAIAVGIAASDGPIDNETRIGLAEQHWIALDASGQHEAALTAFRRFDALAQALQRKRAQHCARYLAYKARTTALFGIADLPAAVLTSRPQAQMQANELKVIRPMPTPPQSGFARHRPL